jgi:hypothetical protein
MSFEAIPDLVAELLQEQRKTNDLLVALVNSFSRVTAEKPVAEKPVAEKPVAEKPVAEKPVAEKPVADGIDYAKHVAPMIIAWAKAFGKPAALAKLEAFGVKSGSALTPDQYPAVIDDFRQ